MGAALRLGLLAGCLVRSAAALGCTSEDATAKRVQLSERLQAVMMQDPARGQALIRRLQIEAASARQDARPLEWDAVCGEYDTWLKEAR